jgi:hypothetical protein
MRGTTTAAAASYQGRVSETRDQRGTTAKAAAVMLLPPPFLLFDAQWNSRPTLTHNARAECPPCRNNAYHYGMAVNGFHPQDHFESFRELGLSVGW